MLRGLIGKAEFEPRLSELRRRVAKLEADAGSLKTSAEQTRCLQLVIGKLEAFAAIIADRLEAADWATQRDLIRTLVQRIEIDDDHVRVVFRIDPGPSDRGGPRSLLQHCPPRDGQLPGKRSASSGRSLPARVASSTSARTRARWCLPARSRPAAWRLLSKIAVSGSCARVGRASSSRASSRSPSAEATPPTRASPCSM